MDRNYFNPFGLQLWTRPAGSWGRGGGGYVHQDIMEQEKKDWWGCDRVRVRFNIHSNHLIQKANQGGVKVHLVGHFLVRGKQKLVRVFVQETAPWPSLLSQKAETHNPIPHGSAKCLCRLNWGRRTLFCCPFWKMWQNPYSWQESRPLGKAEDWIIHPDPDSSGSGEGKQTEALLWLREH